MHTRLASILAPALLLAAPLLALQSQGPESESGPARGSDDRLKTVQSVPELLEIVAGWSDEELKTRFEGTTGIGANPFEAWSLREACLTEMADRGAEAWERYLADQLAEGVDPELREGSEVVELEVLTALRRLQGRPDPLKVRIENADELDCVFPELPVLEVRLQNMDGESFVLTDGGNYRSGRLERWRMEVRDEHGAFTGVLEQWSGIGGGMYMRRPLRPRELWGRQKFGPDEGEAAPVPLPLRSYASLPGAGRYTVAAQYHNERPVAALADVRGLILSASEPVTFTWKVREVRLEPEERVEITTLLESLYEERPVVLFNRPYDDAMRFEGEPSSLPEAIYRYGWKALPVLLDELEQDEDPGHRAWLLAMLTNLTGLHGRHRMESAYGSYRMVGGPVVTGGSGGALHAGGSGTDGGPTRRGQARMVEAWMGYRDMVRTVE